MQNNYCNLQTLPVKYACGRIYTLSGRIGKVVTSHDEVARSIPGYAETTDFYYARGAQEVLSTRVGGCDQSIGFIVSDAIVRSWLWSTATRSSPLLQCGNSVKLY